MRSSVPGRELGALGRGGRAGGDGSAIGVGAAACSGRTGRGGFAGAVRPGAAQPGQIAQPDTRDRGIDHLVPINHLQPY